MYRIIFLLSVSFLFSGCSAYKAWYGTDKPMMSYVIVKESENKSTDVKPKIEGYIITWSPQFNGAFVSSSGKGCIQPAIYAVSESGEAAIPTEIFTQGTADKDLQAKYAESLEKLITVTDQSTFLSIGMYGICQLAAAGSLDANQTSELVKLLFEKAAKSNVDKNIASPTSNSVAATVN